MSKEIKNLKLDDVKVNTPKRKKINKSSEAKTIRISLENYEFLRKKAFNNDTNIKELADDILNEIRKNNQ